MADERTPGQILAQLAACEGAMAYHLDPQAPASYFEAWADGPSFVNSWEDTPVMQFAEYEATGEVRVSERVALAELSLRYLHDDTGDNDRDVQVAVIRISSGDFWVVIDLVCDPDTGEALADAGSLRELCGLGPDARRHAVRELVLGAG